MKFLFFIVFIFSNIALASDHIDSAKDLLKHPISDLTDFYFFPSPTAQDENTVVLTVNTHIAAYTENHFNEGMVFQFHLAETSMNVAQKRFEHQKPKTISCYFDIPKDHSGHHTHDDHHIRCLLDGQTQPLIAGHTGEIVGYKDGTKLFAGLRSDPFFFSRDWIDSLFESKKVPWPVGTNAMKDLNVLSVIIEIDLDKVFPKSSSQVYAANVSVSALKADNRTILGQLDWIGRPEITNFTLTDKLYEDSPDLRDAYNKQIKPFHGVIDWGEPHVQLVYDNLNMYDLADGEVDRTTTETAKLTEILLNDALILDPSMPCLGPKENYLNIEKALLAASEEADFVDYKGCGGRQLEDDFIDIMFNHYIQNSTGNEMVSDGIETPQKPSLSEFPYMAEPEISEAGEKAKKDTRRLLWVLRNVVPWIPDWLLP